VMADQVARERAFNADLRGTPRASSLEKGRAS
jgi:hypothetical protein